jgi:hypothetical protein
MELKLKPLALEANQKYSDIWLGKREKNKIVYCSIYYLTYDGENSRGPSHVEFSPERIIR